MRLGPESYERTHVGGRPARYLAAGEGPPLVLLHALGDNALDWAWALPILARGRRVYAPDLPGIGGDGVPPADLSPEGLASFVVAFLDALDVGRAAVVGSSLGGLLALRIALTEPARVGALGLVGAAGLGREITPALSLLTVPGYGEATVALGKTPFGVRQRARGRAALLFARPGAVPREWYSEQHRLARTPGFLEAVLRTLRAQATPAGQREVLLERLPDLDVPTLVLWGEDDRVLPSRHGHDAASRLRAGELVIIPGCGHLPHVERPDRFAEVLVRFLDKRTDL